ncbi:MAG: OmpA family protein [Nitrospiraceae bacterium]
MKQPAIRSAFAMVCLPACLMVVVLVGGCASESQTVSGSQEIAKPAPPPPPPPPEPPPPPPKQEEIVAEAAAAPAEDPLAWAAGLADAHFDYNRSKIRDEDRPGLDALAQKLKEDGKRKVVVEGHCDSRGTANYNLMLGERRAKSVKQYLVKAGAPNSQIEVVSYGKEKPLCMEMTDECWHNNRRAHFTAQ